MVPHTDIKGMQLLLKVLDRKVDGDYKTMLNNIFTQYLAGDRSMIVEPAGAAQPPSVATEEGINQPELPSPKRAYEQSVVIQPKRIYKPEDEPEDKPFAEEPEAKRTYRQMQAEDGSYEKLMKETQELFDTYKHAPPGVDSAPLAKLAMEKLYAKYGAANAASYSAFGGFTHSEMKPDPGTEVTIGDMVTKVLGQIKKSEFASVARHVEREYRLKHKTGPRKFLGKTDVYPLIHKQDITDFIVQWWRNTYKPVVSLSHPRQYSTRNLFDF